MFSLLVLAARAAAFHDPKAPLIGLDGACFACRQGCHERSLAAGRTGVRSPVGPKQPMLLDPKVAQRLAAEPMGSRRDAHGANDAADLAAVQQRQQVGLKFNPMASIDDALKGQMHHRSLLADAGEPAFEPAPVFLAPAVEEILAAQFRAEYFAHPGAG